MKYPYLWVRWSRLAAPNAARRAGRTPRGQVPAGWTAFGVSAGITVLAAASAALAGKPSRRFGHGLIGLVALWSLVAAVAFSGTVLTWLVFADAIAVGVLALADLAAHEATTERIVHQLEVRDVPTDGRIAA